jgi:putative pyruvate formate lyase activating enzyme
MVNQMKAGHARAVIVRHLVLPDALDDSRETLQRLWNYFGNRIHLSLMTQYFPTYQTENHPALGRRLKPEEYEEIVAYARRLGFKRGWVQTLEEEVGIPLYCLQ